MVREHRRYSAKTRAAVVGLAASKGQTVASEETGIPLSTVHLWYMKPEYAELRTKTREDVADSLWTAIQIGIGEVAKGITGDAPLRDKATALGILYDKHALMTGGATNRSENRELNDLPDSAYLGVLREADRILSGEGTATQTEDPATR